MNYHRIPSALCCILLALITIGLSHASAAVLYDFSSSTQFTDNFATTGGAGTIAWSSSPGVGGDPGRVNAAVPTTNGKTSYYNQTWDPNTGSLQISFIFLASAFTDTTASRIAIGVSETQLNLQGNSEVQVRLLKSGAMTATFEVRDGTGTTNTTGISLLDNTWYSMSMTLTVSGPTSYSVTGSLDNLGTGGTSTPISVGTASGTRNVSSFFTNGVADPVYAGFLVQNSGGGGQAFDNVSMSTVPEPVALSLAFFGAFMVYFTKRKRSLVR